MKERIAIIDGIRTPFCKSGGVFRDWQADDLGAFVVRELLARSTLDPDEIDELIFGNVLQPPHATNVARVLGVKGGLPVKVPAFTVNRNCASGMESIASAINKILVGNAEIIIVGGTESMSNFPVLFRKEMRELLQRFSKARTWKQRMQVLFSFRFGYLVPQIPAIADPLCGLSMGQCGEILSREFKITRHDQDEFATMSQQRAANAREQGWFAEEIVPIPSFPGLEEQTEDNGIRPDTTVEGLAKLRPAFDKATGTVTAGNSSQMTDGAAALMLMKESRAKKMNLTPLGYVRDYSCVALEPSLMGLGPAYAISKLFEKTGLNLPDIDLVEINEAFASQVIAVERALASEEFCRRELGRDKAVGKLDRDRLNVNGGAIALGHPIGVSGTRLVHTLLKELNRRNKNLGIASLCIGGGQGEAMVVEVS